MTLRSTLPLVVAALVGCTPMHDTAVPTRTDSSGVLLIEYPTNLEASSDRNMIAESEPLLSIGEPTPELYQVMTARFLSNGGFVVANGSSKELLLFDDAGRLLTRVGGEGGGPGEFRQIWSLSVGANDSLYAYDQRERRISVFDHNGVFARAVTLRGLDTLGRVADVGVMHSGEIVGAFRPGIEGPGLVRDSLVMTTFASSGEPAQPIGVFPHTYTHWGPHTNPLDGERMPFPLPVPLSGVTAISIGGTSVYLGLPHEYALIRLELNGNRRETRWMHAARTVTDVHRDRLFAALGEGRLGSGPELEMLRTVTGPSTLPAFGSEPMTQMIGEQAILVTDVDGVWLQPFLLPDDSGSAAWPRFNGSGLYEGTATMPPRFRPTAVRANVVLGVYKDAADVEYVRAYRLTSGRLSRRITGG